MHVHLFDFLTQKAMIESISLVSTFNRKYFDEMLP